MRSNDSQPKLYYDRAVTIAVGESISSSIDLYGTSLVSFDTDANLTGTVFTIESASTIDGVYKQCYTNDAAGAPKQISIGVLPDKNWSFSSTDFVSKRFIRFVSNAQQATNPTVIDLVTKQLN